MVLILKFILISFNISTSPKTLGGHFCGQNIFLDDEYPA